MSPLARKLILFAFALLLAFGVLAAAEAVLALFDVAPARTPAIKLGDAIDPGARVVVWDRDLLYRYAPNSDFLGYYRTNSLGYRGPELAEAKGESTYRILCFGDSCTFGLGVRENETWAAVLERALNRAYDGVRRFEVRTFGVIGYSSFQSRRQIEIEVPRFRPDLVVFMPTVVNDGFLAPLASDADRARANRGWRAQLSGLRLGRLLGHGTPEVNPRDSADWAIDVDPTRARVPLAEYPEHLVAAVEAARQAGSAMVLVAFETSPAFASLDPGRLARAAVVEQVAREEHVALADPRPAFREMQPYAMHIDGVHPTADGMRLIASAVLRAIVADDSILPAEPRREFLRFVLRARERGSVAEASPFATGDADGTPALFRGFVDRLSGGAPLSDAAEAALMRYDPVDGIERSRYALGALLLPVAAGAPQPPGVAERVALMRLHVRPVDAFHAFLFGGEEPREVPGRWRVVARALAAYERWLDFTMQPVDRREGTAIDAFEAGRPNQALALLEQVLALEPASCSAGYQTARMERLLNQRKKAREQVELVLAQDPLNAPALALAGVLALEANDEVAADDLLQRAVAADPLDPMTRYGRARLLLKRGEKRAARRELETVAVINATAFPDLSILLAQTAEPAPPGGN